MKQKLSYTDRIELLLLLPTKGSFMALRAAEDLRKDLALTQDEMKLVEMEQDGEMLKWDLSKEAEKEHDFTEFELEVVRKSLKGLDESEELRQTQMELYGRFVENE